MSVAISWANKKQLAGCDIMVGFEYPVTYMLMDTVIFSVCVLLEVFIHLLQEFMYSVVVWYY